MRRSRPLWLPVFVILVLMASSAPARAADAPYMKLERFTLRLINCTRTGGWVRADGTCKDFGSGEHSAYRAPLVLRAGLSDRVARPYARRIARADYCGHGLGGSTIGERFRDAGFMGTPYGENVACGWGDATVREIVIRTHRSMQAEKSYDGWHWKNMKDPDFGTIGIGIARVDGEVRIVEDFYRP
jgi:hypothetical protein